MTRNNHDARLESESRAWQEQNIFSTPTSGMSVLDRCLQRYFHQRSGLQAIHSTLGLEATNLFVTSIWGLVLDGIVTSDN